MPKLTMNATTTANAANAVVAGSQPILGAILTHGAARGVVLALSEPLSFWGGYDAPQGVIIEPAHPHCGASLAGRILMMPRAKGSSSSSSVLAEAIRVGTGPAGIILRERDLIIAIGAIVASDLYGIHVPVVALADADFDTLFAEAQAAASVGGVRVSIDAPEAGRHATIERL